MADASDRPRRVLGLPVTRQSVALALVALLLVLLVLVSLVGWVRRTW